ncbi:MAG: glucokinase, partial [Tepidisphaeraceae bacterium]
PGLRNIYDFVLTLPGFSGGGVGTADPKPPEITTAALTKTSAAAVEAMNMFVSIYGSEAGNLALKTLATAGVWLGGGIAPKILPFLKSQAFLDAFRGKSVAKTQAVLARIPLHVITFELNGLYGAANYARSL